MASTNLFVIFAIAAIVLATASVAATEYWVGGSNGWTVNFDYQAWASDKVFHVGDTLVFNYTRGVHNVFKVNGTEFKDCIKPPEKLALTSGHDVVTLASPGKKWYICGKMNHCSALNQKLVINVEEALEVPAPAPVAGGPAVPTGSAYGIVATSPYKVSMAAAVALGITAFI